MSRTISTAFGEILDDAYTHIFWLAKLAFATPLYLHTDLGHISWDSHTWVGVGDLGGVGEVEETSDLSAPPVWLTLNGLDSEIAARARTEAYTGKFADVYIGARNVLTGAFITDPVHLVGGTMEEMTIVDGPEASSIELTIEDERALFDRSANVLLTNAQQQTRYPGDPYFEFLSYLQELQLAWGLGRTEDLGKSNPPPVRWPDYDDDY